MLLYYGSYSDGEQERREDLVSIKARVLLFNQKYVGI